MRIIIEDNAFGNSTASLLAEYYRKQPETLKSKYLNKDILDPTDLLMPELINFTQRFFDLSNMVGYERWGAVDSSPQGWHIDKDETRLIETGKLVTPICTIIYYPEVSNMIGGRFITETESISPKTDRLIIFGPGLMHAVEPFMGNRIAVVYNPWDHEISVL